MGKAYNFFAGKPEGKRHSADLYVDEKVIISLGRCGLVHLAQDRDQWQALVNMVMNLQFS
jgi:hypothetical protein